MDMNWEQIELKWVAMTQRLCGEWPKSTSRRPTDPPCASRPTARPLELKPTLDDPPEDMAPPH